MAGVLFIIWVPCERYEQILSHKQIWETTATTSRKLPEQLATSSSEDEINYSNAKESKHSSLETFAISIESDSLNRADKKDVGTDKRKQLPRTKSVDDLTTEKIPDDRSREKPGSMDSDTFKRLMTQRARMRENEEAVDRFFGANMERVQLDELSSMEKVIREIIEQMHIKNSSWVSVNSGNSYQVTFSLENGVRCDDTIHMLSEFGIGQKEGSSIAIIPCTLYNDRHRVKDDDEETNSGQSLIKETAWNKFIGTVRARMNVAKIVEAVKSDATLSFDFIVMLIVASILACFGLVENSTLFLAASMLISPLMGPILAATFGAVIRDLKLGWWGLRNEFIGISMCILVGFIFGLATCGFYNFGFHDQELTPEMIMRTNFRSVIVGICIALPSGAAVAIAVLGENFGSLVGVAISASLLPPACNTGLLWSFSFVHLIFKDVSPQFQSFIKENKYSDNQAVELLALGAISLCVTLTNVFCIYIMGFIFLKVKEVAPASDDQRQFWKHDIKIARDYNKTLHADDGVKLKEELAQFHENASENFKGVGAELLRQSHFPHSNTLTLRHHRKETHNTQTSLRDFDALYMNLSGRNVGSEKHHRHFANSRGPSPPHDTNKYSTTSPKHNNGSTPLHVITEMHRNIQTEETLVSFDGQPGPSGPKKKFIVTPAHDPLI